MGIGELAETVLVAGGAVYILDKVTGKKKRIFSKSEIKKRAKRVTKSKRRKK